MRVYLISLGVFMWSAVSFAGEGLFSRAYTTETVPQGHYEWEQTIRNRSERAYGEYSAFDFKTEYEYGLMDNFQIAFYLNTELLNAEHAPDDNDVTHGGDTPDGFTRNSFFLQSVAMEFIYRLTSPVSSPLGIALYYEPQIDFYDMHNGMKEDGALENEFRVLFQKNFMDDQLILVYNLVFELEYFRYGGRDQAFMGELDWNNEIGATYRVASNWYAGLEARNHNELGNFWSHDHSVYWVGPAVHYAKSNYWATLGSLIEVYGVPSGPDENGSDQGPKGLFLHSHERFETTLKVGFPF